MRKILLSLILLLTPLVASADESTTSEGCTDTTATNYDPTAQVHVESMCIYPSVYTPQNITGYIDTVQVQSGATTWNIPINLNMTGVTLDTSKVQLWNQFRVSSIMTQDSKIILTLSQYDGDRLSVECTSYAITIPSKSLTTSIGDKNAQAITGNFSVLGCPDAPPPPPSIPQEDKPTYNAELNASGSYLPIFAQKDGVVYIDIKALSFVLFFILLCFSVFYLIFRFLIKK